MKKNLFSEFFAFFAKNGSIFFAFREKLKTRKMCSTTVVKDYPVIAKCFCQCQIIAVQRYYKCTFRELSDGQEYIYSMSFFTFQQSFGLVIMLPAHVSSPFLYLLLLCLASILQIILLSVDSWFMLDSWINCGNPTIQSTSTRTIR